MKWFVALLLLFGVSPIEGNLAVKEFGQFTLRFDFPSSLSSLKKSCGKLFPYQIYVLLDSFGYRHDILKGRVAQTETNGSIEFKISQVRLFDSGLYRCFVDVFYRDYHVVVIESRKHYDHPQTSTSFSNPQITTSSTELAQEEQSSKVRWSSSWTLVAIISAAVILFIASVVLIVCLIVRGKRSKPDNVGVYESTAEANKDIAGIVYTTVDFKPKQSELYENLRTQYKAGESSLNEGDVVEYSTLTLHQRL